MEPFFPGLLLPTESFSPLYRRHLFLSGGRSWKNGASEEDWEQPKLLPFAAAGGPLKTGELAAGLITLGLQVGPGRWMGQAGGISTSHPHPPWLSVYTFPLGP